MIDLHSHFLPGVDDGAKDMEMCLAMLRQAESAGITHLLATPHINEHSTPAVLDNIRNVFDQVKQAVMEAGISLELRLAGEIHFNSQILQWLDYDWLIAGNNQKYLMLELPIQGLPLNLEDIIFKLRLKQITPILAHPERNTFIQRNPGQLKKWIDLGCLMQMNAGSIAGHFGSAIRDLSWKLLRDQKIHFVCSDAHDTKRRTYEILVQAYNKISEKMDIEYADCLFKTNPCHIWAGEPVSLPQMANYKSGSRSLYEKWLSKLKLLVNNPIMY